VTSCKRCGGLTRTPRHHYCDVCRSLNKRLRDREREQRGRVRPTPKDRGYGVEHRRLRVRLQRLVDAGLALCARCGKPVLPGQSWDLGHDDHDRSRYNGIECVPCNRATAGRRVRSSRRW